MGPVLIPVLSLDPAKQIKTSGLLTAKVRFVLRAQVYPARVIACTTREPAVVRALQTPTSARTCCCRSQVLPERFFAFSPPACTALPQSVDLSLFFPFDLMDQPYPVTNKLICSSCQQLPSDRYRHIPSLVVTQQPKPQHCAKVPFFPCVGGRRQGVACVHRLELNLPATARATAHQWLLA